MTREVLSKSASADSERFCFLRKFPKVRNTVCISTFGNCTEGAKDPLFSRGRFIQSFPIYEAISIVIGILALLVSLIGVIVMLIIELINAKK